MIRWTSLDPQGPGAAGEQAQPLVQHKGPGSSLGRRSSANAEKFCASDPPLSLDRRPAPLTGNEAETCSACRCTASRPGPRACRVSGAVTPTEAPDPLPAPKASRPLRPYFRKRPWAAGLPARFRPHGACLPMTWAPQARTHPAGLRLPAAPQSEQELKRRQVLLVAPTSGAPPTGSVGTGLHTRADPAWKALRPEAARHAGRLAQALKGVDLVLHQLRLAATRQRSCWPRLDCRNGDRRSQGVQEPSPSNPWQPVSWPVRQNSAFRIALHGTPWRTG